MAFRCADLVGVQWPTTMSDTDNARCEKCQEKSHIFL